MGIRTLRLGLTASHYLKAIESCRIWNNTGRPNTQYKKILYKKRIREEQITETSYFTNDLRER